MNTTPQEKVNTNHAPGTGTLLASASLVFGLALGLLEAYSAELEASPANFVSSGYSSASLAVGYTTLVVTYPVTVAVFYVIGNRRGSGYITGGKLLSIYGGAFVGEILAQTTWVLLSGSGASFVAVPTEGLSFLFVAISGFALSNLSLRDAGLVGKGRGLLVASLVALPFGAVGNFFTDAVSLNGNTQPNTQLLNEVNLLVLALYPVQLVAFYYLGRRYSIGGITLRYFGQLFLGLYVGTVVGAALAVALFGQNSWAVVSGASLSFENGVVYQNVAPSLQTLLEALNPIRSLPFLPFFAMALSRTAQARKA